MVVVPLITFMSSTSDVILRVTECQLALWNSFIHQPLGPNLIVFESRMEVVLGALDLELPPHNRSSVYASNNDMSQSVHADFLPDCQRRRPVTPDCSRRSDLAFGDNYASLGRPRPSTASVKASTVAGGGRRWTSGSVEEFYLQVGMQVLCTGELELLSTPRSRKDWGLVQLVLIFSGTLRYIGPVDFTDGLWLGVELRGPHGRHDGAVAGHRYFTCTPNHGVLVRPSRVTFRGINAAKLLPPGMVAAYEKPHAKSMDASIFSLIPRFAGCMLNTAPVSSRLETSPLHLAG
ncbi:CAP-Gly domain-containing linker protein 4 [Taenia solium]|eukprot:TsM_000278700 transcript=TsM_000278700 gene=TsM_000278700